MAAHQEIELNMDVTNKSKVLQSLENNEVDFALVSILPGNMAIEKLELLQNKLYLVGKSTEQLASEIRPEEIFKHVPIIYREQGSGTRQTMEAYFEANGYQSNKKMELTSNEAVKQAVLAGLGYSIMPLIGIRNELSNKQLQIIPIKGLPIQTVWSLIWLKRKKHSPVATEFLHFLKEKKEEIVQKRFSWYEDY
jgi:DNA-binding transcriptional LysR family regulator